MKGPLNISQAEGIDDEEEDFEMEPVALPCRPPAQQSGHSLDRDNDTEKRTQVLRSNVAMKLARFMDTIRQSFVAVQTFAEDLWLRQYGCAGNPDITRVYQVWPGNNVFFFHGRLICGLDPRGLVLTTVSIILSSWVFAMYREDDLPQDSGLITAFSLILTVLVNLFSVSTIDPGIIPRNDGSCIEETAGTSDGTRRMRVTVNGVELKLKYCRICKFFRPPRSCHCAVCDNCVEKFDHHCPWIGQCIALRNYRFYLTFVVSALIFFVYVFAFSCRRIHQRMLRTGTGFLGMLKNCPETLALVSFSFPAILFLGGLTILHVFLLARNQTGYENFRESYMGSQNPFDRGMPSNIMEVLFEPLPPSRVDFRAEVMMPRGVLGGHCVTVMSVHTPPATSHQPPVMVNGVAETTCYMWSRPEGGR
uniref:S-acyltransferase n=1 Tax=Salix viminalis TaxID=40686 RepID=A0A6N2MEU3_SALVM